MAVEPAPPNFRYLLWNLKEPLVKGLGFWRGVIGLLWNLTEPLLGSRVGNLLPFGVLWSLYNPRTLPRVSLREP